MWLRVTTIMILGYFLMGRSFAHFGIPPLRMFVGEIVLAAFLVFGPYTGGQPRWPWVALDHPKLRHFRRAYLLFFLFGIAQTVRGIFSGYPSLNAMRDFSFNYYPLYFFLGLWAGLQDKSYLQKIVRLAAWVNGVYGILFIVILSRLPWHYPSGFEAVDSFNPVPLFGQPSFSAVILLGLLSFEKNLRRVWVPLVLNAFVLLGMLIRAEWFAIALGLLMWAWYTKNVKRLTLCGGILVGILAVMYFANFTYEGPQTRGGTISATDIVGRVIAPLNPDLAKDYTSDVHQFGATAAWRTLFWAEIWTSVHENIIRSLFGYGYGFPLNELLPDLVDPSTRSPHNEFFFVLGYTGWIGIVIFALLQTRLARLLWATYKASGQPYGVIFWFTMLSFSIFTPFFETPYGAIPFFLVTGCACAPLFCSGKAEAPATASAIEPLGGRGTSVRRICPLPSKAGLEGSR
jgi:hypothetical protein